MLRSVILKTPLRTSSASWPGYSAGALRNCKMALTHTASDSSSLGPLHSICIDNFKTPTTSDKSHDCFRLFTRVRLFRDISDRRLGQELICNKHCNWVRTKYWEMHQALHCSGQENRRENGKIAEWDLLLNLNWQELLKPE